MATRNFDSDFGGIGNDSFINDTAFSDFRTWARAEVDPVVLTLTSGGIYRVQTGVGVLPFDGILDCTIQMSGATIRAIADAPRFGAFAGFRFQQAGVFSARLYPVAEGDTIARCKTVGQAASFPVGRWMAIACDEKQGTAGYPPNHQQVQFVQILATPNPATGEIPFSPPAKENMSDSYPETSVGVYDTGGPVTAFLMIPSGATSTDASWGCTLRMVGGNGATIISSTVGQHQIYLNGKTTELYGLTFVDCAPIPTLNKLCHFEDLVVPDIQIEWDKAVEKGIVKGGSYKKFNFQSGSCQEVEVENVTITGNWFGTPRRLRIKGGCTIPELRIGPQGYGNTESVVVEGVNTISAVTETAFNKSATTNFSYAPGGSITYSGGGVIPWGSPGSGLYLAGQLNGGSNFAHIGFPTWISEVKDVGGFPKFVSRFPTLSPPFLTGPVYVVQHPCRSVTFGANTTGSPEAVDLSLAPPGLPLWSYANRTNNFAVEQVVTIRGYLKYLKINVTRADTGANGTAPLHMGGQFSNVPIILLNGSDSTWGPIVNTKITGLRTITPTVVSGAQAGDTLPDLGKIWFISFILPRLNTDISGYTEGQKPIVTVEMLTDQFQAVGRLM